MTTPLVRWLRDLFGEYTLEPQAIFRSGLNPTWPLIAHSEDELKQKLQDSGHFLPLPKEPAALANVLEVSIADFLLMKINATSNMTATRGTERGYPDIEITDTAQNQHHAVDIKVARREKNGLRTVSRITLYTGNTYFRYPQLKWPGTFRPFDDYQSHLDIIAIYTFNETAPSRIEDVEIIVTEAWRIASHQRSSTTREYLGAVTNIDGLRNGKGEFSTQEEFYRFWRRYAFKVGRVVQQQLDKLLNQNKAKQSKK